MMLMCTLSLIMTIIVLNLHHRSRDMYEMPDLVRRQLVIYQGYLHIIR